MDNIPAILVEHGFAKDEYWATTLIKHGCITLDGEVIYDENIDIPIGSKLSQVSFIIKYGKRKWAKVLVDDV